MLGIDHKNITIFDFKILQHSMIISGCFISQYFIAEHTWKFVFILVIGFFSLTFLWIFPGFSGCSPACNWRCIKRRKVCRSRRCYCRYVLIFIFYLWLSSTVLCDNFCEVLDTAAGVWLDRNGIVTSSRTNRSCSEYDSSLDLLRRCRHASSAVGVQIYIYGGLKGGKNPPIILFFHFNFIFYLSYWRH